MALSWGTFEGRHATYSLWSSARHLSTEEHALNSLRAGDDFRKKPGAIEGRAEKLRKTLASSRVPRVVAP